MKSLSTDQVNQVITFLELGQTTHPISASTGFSNSIISCIHTKHCPNLPKATGGHPSIISPTDMQHATQPFGTGKAENAVQITKTLQDVKNHFISPQTICCHLKKASIKVVVKQKCPLLSKHHRRERLDFALSHQDWTVDDWKHVIWSDETKTNRIGSDGRKWAWKKAGEGLSDRLVEDTVKFGGGPVMMWGCMTWDGVGMACKIDGKMDTNLYVQILKDELQQTLVDYGFTTEDIIFQQDNDPKHTSRKAKVWLREHGFEVRVWPAQSPDLNPIEHLWFLLKRRLAAYPEPAKGILDLWERIQEEWYKIEVGECQRLIESMPRRVQEVIKAKGGYTSY